MPDAVRTALSQRCPRCSAPIVGDYRFCPACAYRLRPGSAEVLPAPAPRSSAWKTWSLAATIVAAILAAALGYVLLTHPQWMKPTPTEKPTVPIRAGGVPLSRILRVEDLRTLLVELPPDVAVQGYRENPTDPERAAIPAYVNYTMKVMPYETTRGMYAEFIRDLEQHRERIPAVWLATAKGPITRDEVELVTHVPLGWRVFDPQDPTTAIGWYLPESDANLPVTQVNVYDASGFAEWASQRLGVRFDLPVWFEWVRAARGGQPNAWWPWGSQKLFYACNNRAFWGSDKRGQLFPVQWPYLETESGGATAEGVWGMAGNAQEIALDHRERIETSFFGDRPVVVWEENPQATYAWGCGGSYKLGIDDCRCDARVVVGFDEKREDLGFRLVVRRFD